MASVKFCISGLSETESNTIKKTILRNKGRIELLEDNTLHLECTHVITKTNPQLTKSEKVLSALARGIPILDIKDIKNLLKPGDEIKMHDEGYLRHYDIGGKRSIIWGTLTKIYGRTLLQGALFLSKHL